MKKICCVHTNTGDSITCTNWSNSIRRLTVISNSALHILEEETEANTMKQLSQKHADRPDTEGTMLIVMSGE